MSPKQWLALLAFYIAYLFFGASVFYTVEQRLETERRVQALHDRSEVNGILKENLSLDNLTKQHEILEKVSIYCEKPVTNYTEDKYIDPYVWTFYHSFFFSFTVISTVGYGNISPNNTFGRIFMIFYAIVGLPVNFIMFAGLGEFFGNSFKGLYNRYRQYKEKSNSNYVTYKLGLIAQVTLYLVPGIFIFIFLPSCLFTYFEDWPYSVSVFYAFVTLTTIGFGDFAVTFQPYQERVFGVYFILYEIFVIFWFIFGVGYLAMILGFLVKGLQSKRVKQLEHQLSLNLKETQQKIWHGVTKDVGYLRKILNEVYMMRFKPVYNEAGEKEAYHNFPRSESCPDLSIYGSTPTLARKRAMSDNFQDKMENTSSTYSLNQTHSDSDLSKIDKKRTFEPIKFGTKPGDLLAQVVSALGNFRPPDEDNDSVGDIQDSAPKVFTVPKSLGNERTWSGWSLQNTVRGDHDIYRDRSSSEVKIPMHDLQNNHEWTWSGSNSQMKDIMRLRQKVLRKEDLYRASFGTQRRNNANDVALIMPQDASDASTNVPSSTILDKFNIFRRRNTGTSSKRPSLASNEPIDTMNNFENAAQRRPSKVSLPRQYHTQSRRRSSGTSLLTTREADTDLLEKTTIADLIRALEVMHTQTNFTDLAEEPEETSQKKLGNGNKATNQLKVPSFMSLFPQNSYDGSSVTNVADRRHSALSNMNRRQSALPGLTSINRKPPPYSTIDSPMPIRRRFSVRPSALGIPPGQAPPVNLISLQPFQRRFSVRPSPLARQQSNISTGSTQSNDRSRLPFQLPPNEENRSRDSPHGSFTNLKGRKRTESNNF